ncbi:hypothetical protein CDA63_16700 [Hymenobacter amundsenii]|uniref:O-antigen polysaccharide polymerase Wzy n=1 Tax=Hymenobacter amundsenii TaxID=2006685 RepID=A0A246FHE8_9BACT|nr:hypothetical protein [Hymenobacter amundsenii]OWP61941.1 hypothetical protein CDA63_16700 [Hymenobacter amundsenii]
MPALLLDHPALSPTPPALVGPAPVGLAPAVRRGPAFLRGFVRWSWVVLVAASLIQSLWFATQANQVAVLYVLGAWALLTPTFLTYSSLARYPISSFLMLGFGATQFYLPLLFTLLEGKPLVTNLELPYAVFEHSMLALLVLLTAHYCYRVLARVRLLHTRSLLRRLGVYTPPTHLQLWLMGLIGVAAMFYIYVVSQVGWAMTGSSSDKFIQTLIPFSYAPYFIYSGRLYGSQQRPAKSTALWLLLFTIMLFVVSIGRNSRAAFMLSFTAVGFSYGLGLLLGVFENNLLRWRNVLLAGLGIWFLMGPMSDLGTAMVIVREKRHDISKSELISLTYEAFWDEEALRDYRAIDYHGISAWDESYLDNIFTARFANLKFNDESLLLNRQVGNENPAIYRYTIDYIWSSLPDPLIRFLGINVDKTQILVCSFGDYLFYTAGNVQETLSGFRTGHFAGTGMAAFGWWYLLILGLGMIPVFSLFDKLVVRDTASAAGIRFSLCALLALTGVFQFLPFESVVFSVTFLTRGWLQLVFSYVLLYSVARLLSRLFQDAGQGSATS